MRAATPGVRDFQATALEELHRLSQAFGAEGPSERFLQQALDSLERCLGADRSAVLLTDVTGVMRFTSWRGLSDAYRAAVEGHSPWPPDARDPAPVLVEDTELAPELEQLRPVLLAEEIRALGFFPLVARGRLLGKFMVYLARPHQFSAEELTIASTLGNFVASAVAMKRASDEARLAAERTARLQQLTAALAGSHPVAEVGRLIVEHAVDGLGAVAASVYERDEGNGGLRLLAYTGYSDEQIAGFRRIPADAPVPLAEAIRTGREVVITGEEAFRARFPLSTPVAGRRAWASLPLVARERVVGAFGLSFDDAHALDASQLEFLRTLSNQCAAALDRARLSDDERSAQQKLAERTHTLQAVVGASPLAITLTERDGTVRLWNPSAEKIFGWRADEVLDRPHPATLGPDAAEFRTLLEEVFRRNGVSGVPVIRTRRSGETFDAILYASVIANDTSAPLCLSVVADVSATRRSERLQRMQIAVGRVLATAERFEDAIPLFLSEIARNADCSFAHLWLASPDGALRHAGTWREPGVGAALAAAAERLEFRRGVGLPGLVMDQRTTVWVRELTADPSFLRRREAAADGLRFGFAFPIQVGDDFIGVMEFFSPHRLPDDDGAARSLDALGSQIGQFLRRKQAEQRSAGHARDLELLAKASQLLSASLDPEVTAKQLTDLLVPEVCDITSVLLIDDENRLRRAAEGAITPELAALLRELRQVPVPKTTPGHPVAAALAKGETIFYDDFTAIARTSPEAAPEYVALVERVQPRTGIALPLCARGRTIGVLTVGMVASTGRRLQRDQIKLLEELALRAGLALENARLYQELRRSEEETRRALTRAREADRRKDEFLAMLGHELRNPLAPIVTALQLVEMRSGGFARERQIIERQVRHLHRLVDDLLDLARITGGKVELKRERLDLKTVLAQAIETASPILEQRRHHLAIDLGEAPLPFDGDPVRLEQVIANLLVNAAKFTEPGGHISIRAQAEGGDAVVRVRDSGAGIEPDLLPIVFDLFVQAEMPLNRPGGGLGIGLTLVRRMVELHGGRVEAYSDGPGTGSEFVVRLPAPTPLPAQVEPARPAPAFERAPGKRILLVDDNVDAAELLAEALQMVGHEVRLAYDGAQALGVAPEFKPDVALLDIGLPVMDGYELARRLLASLQARPLLVALTGYGQPEDVARARQAGFDLHFVKPVELETIVRAVSGEEERDRRHG